MMTLWDGSFPFYPGINACFPFDTTWAIIASVFLSALVTSIIILPGIRGKGRLFWLLRVVTSLFIGAVVLSEDWESGWVTANTSYKSFSHVMVNADIGLHIGLAGVNITLVGNPVNQVNETINYNEHFAWSFDADYDHSYSEGLEKGLPSPILYVAEKFTTHSPCNVHRQYRISSCYASIMLWMALCTWLISILLFSMPVLLYGGYMLLLTAVLMLFSLLFFITSLSLGLWLDGPGVHLGPMHLSMLCISGLLCLLLGLGVIVLNSVHPQKLKLVFNLDKGMREEVDGWDKSHLPAESSSSEQDVLMVSLDELCEVTATKL
uniref:Dual oxidase maturation factor 1-like n=1 Tax=Coturnix japonica TaxID=93934 RepID=A0A8C2SPF3_COTJA